MMDVHAVAYSFSHKKNRCITVIRAVADIPITERCYKKNNWYTACHFNVIGFTKLLFRRWG
jgi:hypothetical protein